MGCIITSYVELASQKNTKGLHISTFCRKLRIDPLFTKGKRTTDFSSPEPLARGLSIINVLTTVHFYVVKKKVVNV